MRAVIYCRVSSQEQVKNLSLETQTEACTEYCRSRGLEVEETFIERGESARSADRTELQRMLTYCRKRKGHIQFLVVYMLDRFARNQYDHHALKAYLLKLGITVRAVAQPIDDSATGQLMDGILAAFSEFDNNMRRERTMTGMKAALEKGRWVFPTPVGYKKGYWPDGRRTLVPHPDKAPFVRKAFEMAASGLYDVAGILEELQAQGFLGKRDKLISANGLHGLLHNPIYYGRIIVKPWNIDAPTDFEPLIDEETFAKTQLHLSDSRPPITAYRRNNPDFPLRRFVRCGECDQPLTGGWTRGRTQRYGYYECAACRGVRARKQDLEGAFVALLDRLRPSNEVLKLLSVAVLERWSDQQKGVNTRRHAADQRVADALKRKERLVEVYVYEAAIDKETYQEHLARVEEELTLAELELYDAKVNEFDVEGVIAFAEHLVSHASRLWAEAELDQRQRLQKLFFPEGLKWAGGEFRTAVTCPYFYNLEGTSGAESRMVARTGFEPVLPA